MPNDTSVKLPGGEMCPGGTCKKVQTLIRSKFNPTKKRYPNVTTKAKSQKENTSTAVIRDPRLKKYPVPSID